MDTKTSCTSYECQKYEQCDTCFMIDHLKECDWCEHYDHKVQDQDGLITVRPEHLAKHWGRDLMNKIIWGDATHFYSK